MVLRHFFRKQLEVGKMKLYRVMRVIDLIFSERELKFMFAIGYCPSVCLSSVCLSVVCL